MTWKSNREERLITKNMRHVKSANFRKPKKTRRQSKLKGKNPGDNYLCIKIGINILPIVFVVEALKKALLAHGVAWVALTPWTLFSLFIKVSEDHKLWHQNCKRLNLTFLTRHKDAALHLLCARRRFFLKKKQVTHCAACAVIWCTLHVLVLHCGIVYIPWSPWEGEKTHSVCCPCVQQEETALFRFQIRWPHTSWHLCHCLLKP